MKIRDVIKIIKEDEWFQVYQKGSHRQYKHRKKKGRVTIAGHPGDDLATGTLDSVFKQAGIKKSARKQRGYSMLRYLIVIEKANANYSAYSPDLPGCIATGKTRDQAAKNMHEAIELHIQGLKEDHLPIPKAQAVAEYIAITG